MSCPDVNDYIKELIEENERMNYDLVFAYRLIKVLLEMKYNLVNKLREFSDCEYAVLRKNDVTKLIQLIAQFNNICKEKNVLVNEEIVETFQQNSVEKVDKQTSTETLNLDEVDQDMPVNLIEGIVLQVINGTTGGNGGYIIEQQTDNQQGEQPTYSGCLEIHDQQEVQILDGQNNQEKQEHSSNDQDDEIIIIYSGRCNDANVVEEHVIEDQQQKDHQDVPQFYINDNLNLVYQRYCQIHEQNNHQEQNLIIDEQGVQSTVIGHHIENQAQVHIAEQTSEEGEQHGSELTESHHLVDVQLNQQVEQIVEQIFNQFDEPDQTLTFDVNQGNSNNRIPPEDTRLGMDAQDFEKNVSRVMARQFMCNFCSALFSNKSYMARHLNKHTDRFKCQVLSCDYRGCSAIELKRHTLKRHNNFIQ